MTYKLVMIGWKLSNKSQHCKYQKWSIEGKPYQTVLLDGPPTHVDCTAHQNEICYNYQRIEKK